MTDIQLTKALLDVATATTSAARESARERVQLCYEKAMADHWARLGFTPALPPEEAGFPNRQGENRVVTITLLESEWLTAIDALHDRAEQVTQLIGDLGDEHDDLGDLTDAAEDYERVAQEIENGLYGKDEGLDNHGNWLPRGRCDTCGALCDDDTGTCTSDSGHVTAIE